MGPGSALCLSAIRVVTAVCAEMHGADINCQPAAWSASCAALARAAALVIKSLPNAFRLGHRSGVKLAQLVNYVLTSAGG